MKKNWMPGHVRREDMPQVKSTLVGEFLRELSNRQVDCHEAEIPACNLVRTQEELHEENVVALMAKPEQLSKKLLVSVEGFVLDGHHRWEANRRLGKDQGVWVIGLTVELALDAMADFASRHTDLCAAKQ